ncbi:proline dehydrogenase family protein [Alkalihalobacillus sp. BA299]|uniref:proline dehydrogenase family protein n=1 Tax=Alkalihalobacillus sp. BA299 TaxID=2815938 RepID=UPI001ADB5FBD|nr:proline dehydrogenase [Alkalihalobacillus sp. BA299]
MVHVILRNFFLFLSKNQLLNHSARKWGLKLGASQVVAGETISQAIKVVRQLNEKGLICTVDHLGEFVQTKEEAIQSTNYCIRTLNAITKTGVNCNLSLKLTQLGLDVDKQLCYENLKNILSTAKRHNIFVRIDMENFVHCQPTLELLEELRKDYNGLVGTAIQAYLYRAIDDVNNLKGVNLRLVKGAYRESAKAAYQKKEEIDANFLKIIKQHLRNGSYTAVATHDHMIIQNVKEFCKQEQIAKSQFEFQMLYGFRTDLQEEIAKEGYTMRVYVPYGNDWFGYFMRRLAERPQNVSFALRGLFSR